MRIVVLLALSFFFGATLPQANSADPKGEAKITKNEAEHIALKEYKGARVTAAKLEKVEGKLVWAINILGPKGRRAHQITVDALSGRVLGEKKVDR